MNGPYTLQQVKAAGRYAECATERGGVRFQLTALGGRYLAAHWALGGPESEGVISVEIPTSGWHHLPGCDCEFCRP
jgi:hypothetical protein